LSHRPGEVLIVGAYGNKIASGGFYLFVVLSQTGELHRAASSPEAAIKNDHDRSASRVLGQSDEFAIAVGEREVRSLVSDPERRFRDLSRDGESDRER
jgi:hypothetical protein